MNGIPKAIKSPPSQEELANRLEKVRNLMIPRNLDYYALGSLGTSGALDMYNMTGELPIKYFTQTQWDKAFNISGATMAETILVENRFCHSCVIGCGRRIDIKEGKYRTDGVIEGPEYETIVSYGSLLLNDNLESIAYMNTICFDYGIDTISSGGIIACLTHHYTLGNINSEDIDGLKPEWGNIEIAEQILKKIVYRDELEIS